MQVSELLQDAFTRIHECVHGAVADLTAEELLWRADPAANSVAWLVWHTARVQDDHVAKAGGFAQVWDSEGFEKRFDLPFGPGATGFAHTPDQVAQVRADAALLLAYQDAAHRMCMDYVAALEPADLDLVVDTRWDPPVTLGVRLVSVVSDGLQHAGQAALLRGVILRTRG